MSLAFTALLAISLTACSTKAAGTAPDHTADDAAIRRLLTNLADQINRDDPAFVDVFAKDAIIVAPGAPDVVGYDAIRTMYTDLMKQSSMRVNFSPAEILVAGDLAYERGTYTLRIVDKTSQKILQDVKNKDLHIFKRQPDGGWKTWRMMVSSAEPPPAPTSSK